MESVMELRNPTHAGGFLEYNDSDGAEYEAASPTGEVHYDPVLGHVAENDSREDLLKDDAARAARLEARNRQHGPSAASRACRGIPPRRVVLTYTFPCEENDPCWTNGIYETRVMWTEKNPSGASANITACGQGTRHVFKSDGEGLDSFSNPLSFSPGDPLLISCY